MTERFHTCPDCKNQFVQPFKCTTCGAQKLYDATVRSQAVTIEHQREEITRARKALGALAVQALQRSWEEVEEWAKSVKVTFPEGEPEVRS